MTVENIGELCMQFNQLEARRAAEIRAARMFPNGTYRPRLSSNRQIAEAALVREPLDGGRAELWITHNGMHDEMKKLRADPALAGLKEFWKICDGDALNGYIAFPKRRAPMAPREIAQWIPVHGGVTWAKKDSFAAVWGFDTVHAQSESQPRGDQDWIRGHCHILYRGLLLADQLWPQYRRADQQGRVNLAERLLALRGEEPLKDRLGFDALLSFVLGTI